MKKHRGLKLFLLLLLLLIVSLPVVILRQQSERNFPNLTVGDISVERLTEQETVNLLLQNGWEESAITPLTVTTFAGHSFRIEPDRTGLRFTARELAHAAVQYGREGGLLSRIAAWVQCCFGTVDIQKKLQNMDLLYIRKCINDHEAELLASMGDAEVTVDEEAGVVAVVKGYGQLELDRDALSAAIIEAVRTGKAELSFQGLKRELQCPDFFSIEKELEREPVNAQFSGDGRFQIVPSENGMSFDAAEVSALWEAAEPAEVFTVPITIVRPEVTEEELQAQLYRDLLGACTTDFRLASEEQVNNIRLACEAVNGTVLYPGDVFSFNEVVGERTLERGYLSAPAINNGVVKDEVGGRVCQVSSTLYVASVFAFLETVERVNHYYPPSYMQLGTDAAVSIPEDGGKTVDFRFRNSKSWPIRIDVFFDEEKREVTCEIRGTLEAGDYMPVEFDNSWSWVYEYVRQIPPADQSISRPRYRIKLEHERWGFEENGKTGWRTLTHRKVYDDFDQLVKDDILNPVLSNGKRAMDTYYDP